MMGRLMTERRTDGWTNRQTETKKERKKERKIDKRTYVELFHPTTLAAIRECL